MVVVIISIVVIWRAQRQRLSCAAQNVGQADERSEFIITL